MAYADRKIIQLVAGTEAVRAATVIGQWEAFIVTDGAGVPTGAVWIGDGSTVGGIRVTVAAQDHGSLAGLADDDHPIHPRTDGSRNITGTQTFNNGATVNSTGASFLVNALSVLTGGLQLVTSAPLETLLNLTQTNADGGRAGSLEMAGYKADATLHYLGRATVEHDGSSNDQKARLKLYLNRAESGVGALTHKVTLDDHLTVVAGEHRSTAAKWVCAVNSAATTIGTGTVVPFATNVRTDSSAFSRSSTEITCLGAGWVQITADVTGEESALNVRQDLHIEVQRDAGGGYATVTGGHAYGYHRDVSGTSYSTTASVSALLLQVAANDKLRVIATAPAGTFNLIIGACRFTVRTIPAA